MKELVANNGMQSIKQYDNKAHTHIYIHKQLILFILCIYVYKYIITERDSYQTRQCCIELRSVLNVVNHSLCQ